MLIDVVPCQRDSLQQMYLKVGRSRYPKLRLMLLKIQPQEGRRGRRDLAWLTCRHALACTTRKMTGLRTFNTYLTYLNQDTLYHCQPRVCIKQPPSSMSSKKCCLRQHNRREAADLKVIDLSLDDTVLEYRLHGPNLLDSHIQEDCELYHMDDVRPESGSLAILRQL